MVNGVPWGLTKRGHVERGNWTLSKTGVCREKEGKGWGGLLGKTKGNLKKLSDKNKRNTRSSLM